MSGWLDRLDDAINALQRIADALERLATLTNDREIREHRREQREGVNA